MVWTCTMYGCGLTSYQDFRDTLFDGQVRVWWRDTVEDDMSTSNIYFKDDSTDVGEGQGPLWPTISNKEEEAFTLLFSKLLKRLIYFTLLWFKFNHQILIKYDWIQTNRVHVFKTFFLLISLKPAYLGKMCFLFFASTYFLRMSVRMCLQSLCTITLFSNCPILEEVRRGGGECIAL